MWMRLPRHRLFRRAIAGARRQNGQSLVFTAGILTMLLALVALTVDLGSLYVAQRHAQTASDAGSLAAAEDLPLPANTTAAAADSTKYAHTLNDSSASITSSAAPVGGSAACTSPNLAYNSLTPNAWAACFQAQVGVTQTLPLSFERLFGNNTGTVSASAVSTVNLTASTSGGNLVPNGLFPTGCVVTPLSPNPQFCQPGAPGTFWGLNTGTTIGTSGTPWNVWYGNVNWAASGFAFLNYSGPTNNTSANVIDMNGLEDGGISQTVPTVTGTKYLLSFWLSGNASYSESTFTGEVAVGSQRLSATPATEAVPPAVPTAVCPSSGTICVPFTHTNNPANQMTWEQVGIPFTATSTSTIISFLSTSSQISANYANTGPVIAEVGVQPATYGLTQ
jgi:Flp pilus assembly protein TadG